MAIVDAQPVKCDAPRGERGYDAGKSPQREALPAEVLGRKRHIAVDSGGRLLAVTITSANVQDQNGGVSLVKRLVRLCPWIETAIVDSGDKTLFIKAVQEVANRVVEVVNQELCGKVGDGSGQGRRAKYEAKYGKAAACLAKDRETLLAFYDFPAEHWKPIRTGNPIESAFATVRHRTTRAKGCLSRDTGMIMVFKLIQIAQSSWRRLDGQNQLPKAIAGVTFIGGIEASHQTAAA